MHKLKIYGFGQNSTTPVSGYAVYVFRYLFPLVIMAITFCAPDRNVGGTSSGVEAKVAHGTIVREDGTVAANTRVKLISVGYNPVNDAPLADSSIGITNAKGEYELYASDTGVYNIQAVHDASGMRLLIREIHLTGGRSLVPVNTLQAPGTIKIVLGDDVDTIGGYLYLPGTDIAVSLRGTSVSARFDSVPAALFPAVCYTTKSAQTPTVLRNDVLVLPGKTAIIAMYRWKYSARLALNTTASGADVPGNVCNFPVLIRLTKSNFDFTAAEYDGADIRFVKSDSVYLPHQIERWDPVAGLAEVWVKIDTIRGNDSTQSIMMYWGASTPSPSTPSTSSGAAGAAVFDTANGFQGVWHLGESDSIASDATVNRFDGVGSFTSPVAGITGNASHFNGTSSIIRMKGTASQRQLDFPANGSYTLSAWVYHDTLADSATYLIAGKGELQYFMKSFDLALSTSQHDHQWEFTEYHGNNEWQAAVTVPAVAKSWYYLAGVRDGANAYLYVNGVLVMKGYQILGTQQGILPRDTTDDFTVGGFLRPTTNWKQGYAYFAGAIDEVTISNRARGAEWVKLSFMNQKEQDALVRW